MSLPPNQILISADDHLDIHAMPPDVWSSRLPKEWRERGPHVEETPEGPFWFCDGRRDLAQRPQGDGLHRGHDHGFRPGQPQTRLEDMDRDGVRAQVIYGPICTQLQITDAALHEQVARVYNDWAAEFQRQAPERLVLLPDIPSYDPQVAKRRARALREARPQGCDRQQHGGPRQAALRRRVGAFLGRRAGDRHPDPRAPRRAACTA